MSALARFGILDTSPEAAFDDLAQLAASLCNTPFSVIAFVDREREWFKATVGLTTGGTSRSAGFSSHAVTTRAPFLVPDAQADPRFSSHELVVGDPHVRFYCGVPVVTEDGYAIGAIAVMDRVPRTLLQEAVLALGRLAGQVAAQLELRRLRRDPTAVAGAAVRNIADQMVDAVIVTTRDGQVSYMNQEAERLLGIAASELVGQSLHEAVHRHEVDDRRRSDSSCELKDACAGDLARRCSDDRFVKKDGSIAHVSWTIGPLSQGEQCVGHFLTVRDITLQKRKEEVLRLIAGTRQSTGMAFLQELVETLARATGVEYAFCSRQLPGLHRAQALAGCGPDGPMKSFEYDLAGTPCETVVHRAFCHYPTDVQVAFPQDHMLRRLAITSYMALIVPSKTGEPIGWIALLGRAPLRDAVWAESLLRAERGVSLPARWHSSG
ncbi:MAG: PAS domain S-box protein [Nitrospiraceae bacterium]|nr:PAS domain S-box protein [Nitrospiraceae bacterium]